MDYTENSGNKVYLSGVVAGMPTYSHEIYGEGFYELHIAVERLSDQKDILPVTMSERLMEGRDFSVGAAVAVVGQFRSYNKISDGRSKLMLTVFVRELVEPDEGKNPNSVELSGYVCKPPVYRTTPFKREISDVLLAVNRAYNKSDYIPCIAWGRNARYVKNIPVGSKIEISGRIQSREYQKKIDDERYETKIAYEVSVGRVSSSDIAAEEAAAASEEG
jgi:primosomal replication protein N